MPCFFTFLGHVTKRPLYTKIIVRVDSFYHRSVQFLLVWPKKKTANKWLPFRENINIKNILSSSFSKQTLSLQSVTQWTRRGQTSPKSPPNNFLIQISEIKFQDQDIKKGH